MCGITGFIDGTRQKDDGALRRTVGLMSDSLAHRGPDGSGVWTDAGAGIALGHRRLAIVDLSPAGAQPMVSSDGRFIITYNGEVYNFPDLRRDLEAAGHVFTGHSDTEVLLEGCSRWGVDATVAKLVGMFAFALWDRRDRRLVLARDRLGIKPLYWGRIGPLFLFGSELKALRAQGEWRPEIDRAAIAAYLRYNYIPAPHSIYKRIQKLEPGCLLEWHDNEDLSIRRYWQLADHVPDVPPADINNEVETLDALSDLLHDAVSRRMIADVPLGAFLSGGIDSSTVVALMQAASNRPVRSFSIGFADAAYDESGYARDIAHHLGTDHTELTVDPAQTREVVPGLPDMYDEPFADASQIPTYLVSKLTRAHVTVALSGDGGDEVFAGYNRHVWANRIWRPAARVPGAVRGAAAAALKAMPAPAWDAIGRLLPANRRPRQLGDKIHKTAAALTADSPEGFYRSLVSHWDAGQNLMPGVSEAEATAGWTSPGCADLTDTSRYLDTVTYLPDDILAKVDRASMATSLEARVPLLDHRVVEFAWQLPRNMLIRHGESKWALRQILARHVPRALTDRPKMGFAIPIDAWLRGPLKDWAEDLLAPAKLEADGLLNAKPIRRAWAAHVSGRRNLQYPLWGILMLQAWRQRWT